MLAAGGRQLAFAAPARNAGKNERIWAFVKAGFIIFRWRS